MDNPYRTKAIVAASGERLPFLLRRVDGMPLFDPMVYVLSQVRGRSHATATIEWHLRAIMHLLVFAEVEGIDLDQRIQTGRLFAPHELDALAEAAGQPIDALVESLESRLDQSDPPTSVPNPASLERYRARLIAAKVVSVGPASASTRLRAMRDYLKWLVDRRIGQSTDNQDIQARREILKSFIAGIDARIPSARRREGGKLPEGLPREAIQRLIKIVEPEAPDNPWADRRVRIRNQLIVQWLYGLGLRRGDLLAVRISDIQAASQQVSIERRPDSLVDPRTRQPLVKTRGRDLPISSLFHATERYILDVRGASPGAAKHPFLFVGARTGRPLSHSGLTKMFQDLSAALGLPISAHLLRHSWNDSFSALMDQKNVPEATEKKVRSYLQGWSESSNAAGVYTRRHVREEAGRQMLHMQKKLFGKGAEGENE